jgi:hypothetical protein
MMTRREQIEAIAALQSERRRRAGLPPAYVVVRTFVDEEHDESIRHAVRAGADISGTVLLLWASSTRAEWERRVVEARAAKERGQWVSSSHKEETWWSWSMDGKTEAVQAC